MNGKHKVFCSNVKSLLTIALSSLFLVVSCNEKQSLIQEETQMQAITISADIVKDIETKTAIGDEILLEGKKYRKVVWSEGDRIAVVANVNDNETTHEFVLKSGAGLEEAVFEGEIPVGASISKALYPYQEGGAASIASTQVATPGSFDPSVSLMEASRDSENKLVFAHKAAYLKIKTTEAWNKISISSEAAGFSTVELVPAEGQTEIAAGVYYIAVSPISLTSFELKVTDALTQEYKRIGTNELVLANGGIKDLGEISTANLTAIYTREVTVTGLSKYTVTAGDEMEILCSGFSNTLSENKVFIGNTELEVLGLTDTGIRVRVPQLEFGDKVAVVKTVSAAPVEAPAFRYYKLPSSITVSTILGTGTNTNTEGVGTAAAIALPEYVGFGPDGYLWITARKNGEFAIHRANPSNWEMSTALPYSKIGAGVYYWGGSFDSKGDFYVCAKAVGRIDKVVKEEDTYVRSNYAISGLSTNFKSCMNLIFDDSDNMYVADRDNKRIVKIKDGAVVKIYSIGVQPYTIAWDATKENILIGCNAAWAMYKMSVSDGAVTKICGSGVKPTNKTDNTEFFYTDGDAGALSASVGNISGFALDANNNIWFNDNLCHTIRVLIQGPAGDYTKGIVRTVSGSAFKSAHINGEASEARFNALGMMTFDGEGNLIIADGNNYRIRKITFAN